MSRWRSPQAAAKQAERVKAEAEKDQREKRKGRRQLAVMLFLMTAVFVGDLVWRHSKLTNRPERRREHGSTTNRTRASQMDTNTIEKGAQK
jgi:hypothetical protein